MFEQLAESVFAGDLARAEGVLNEMHAIGDRADSIRKAKRRAGRERFTPDPLPVAIPLPQPGRSALEVFGRGGNLAPQGRLRG